MMTMLRFDWWDGQPDNYEHHEMCLTLWEQHDPFFPIVRSDNIIIMMMIENDQIVSGAGLQVERHEL